MKKTLILLIAILFLVSGCEKKVAWQDIESTYKDIETQVNQETANLEVITKDDYQELLDELNGYVKNVEYSQEEENQNLLKNSYKVAQHIAKIASLFEGNCAQQLISLSANVTQLVISDYDGTKDDFESIKNSIQIALSEVNSWKDDQWATVEKKARILWDSVARTFEQIENKTKNNLTDLKDLAEFELDELKHTIIDNYDLIKDGITEDSDAIAKNVYEAAIKLEQYTRKIYSEKADMVWDFAKHTQSFVKSCYGKILEESEIYDVDYDLEVEAARKWTQSTWNEITREIKLYLKTNGQ